MSWLTYPIKWKAGCVPRTVLATILDPVTTANTYLTSNGSRRRVKQEIGLYLYDYDYLLPMCTLARASVQCHLASKYAVISGTRRRPTVEYIIRSTGTKRPTGQGRWTESLELPGQGHVDGMKRKEEEAILHTYMPSIIQMQVLKRKTSTRLALSFKTLNAHTSHPLCPI